MPAGPKPAAEDRAALLAADKTCRGGDPFAVLPTGPSHRSLYVMSKVSREPHAHFLPGAEEQELLGVGPSWGCRTQMC